MEDSISLASIIMQVTILETAYHQSVSLGEEPLQQKVYTSKLHKKMVSWLVSL